MKKQIILILFILQLPLFAQWEVLNEGLQGQITEIDFVNDDVGWMADRDVLYKTLDGGETWLSLSLDKNIRIEKIDYVNENTGWLIADDKILKSDDGGQNWQVQKTVEDEVDLKALYVVNDSVIYFAGNQSTIFKSMDGGETWIHAFLPSGGDGECHDSEPLPHVCLSLTWS